ncbi:MAG: UPF0146 family protein [Syntrophobacteria bacterium]
MVGLIEYLSRHYRRVVEVGIGNYAQVALALRARGLSVVATDIKPRVPGLPVVADDVTAPRLDIYRGAQAIYAVRPPPEIIGDLKRLAQRLAVDLIVKPLAGEPLDGDLISGAGSFFYLFPSRGPKEGATETDERPSTVPAGTNQARPGAWVAR